MSFLKFRIKSKRTGKDGRIEKATIRNLETDRDVDTSDLPIILNALVDAKFEEEENKGFAYKFPFKLS